MFSIIVPVYRNSESIPALIERLSTLSRSSSDEIEVVFVIDGSPDGSAELLRAVLKNCPFQSLLVSHSRNFGSFEAIRTGLAKASGPHFAVMAADLQEPAELVKKMVAELEKGANVVLGTRESREDPLGQRTAARIFWWIYRWIQPDMPVGGADVFACDQAVRDKLLVLREANSSLLGLLVWLGFRRVEVPYKRLSSQAGPSSWTFSRKFRYLMDSLFAFSDLPIRLMLICGGIGILTALILAFCVITARLSGLVSVPGYTATVLIVMFFGGLNLFGLGIIGSYLWRTFENTKGRPPACVQSVERYTPNPS